MKKHFIALFYLAFLVHAVDIQAAEQTQTNPVKINKDLMEKITKLVPNSSNAHEVNMMLGAPSACLPIGEAPSEAWICQWKGKLSSNGIKNTLNITFSAGMISSLVGIDEQGTFFKGELGLPVKIIQ